MSENILVVDDEKDLLELVEYNLAKEGYKVTTAESGVDALKIARKDSPSLIVLDIMLPGMQGLEVLRELKKKPDSQDIPVILLTARGGELDRVLGLELGADDYVTKPFSPRELVARVKAVLRRFSANGHAPTVIKAGGLKIDLDKNKVYLNDNPLTLSPTEFKLLKYLALNRGRVLPREKLLDNVWKDDQFVEPRTVDVHIRRLRAKIEEDPENPAIIKTARGIGYEMAE